MVTVTILVTGAGGPAGINVIRSLRKRHRVIATDMNRYSEGFLFSDKYYVVNPAWNGELFLKDLEEIIRKERVDLVIVTVDEEIEILSRHRVSDRFVLHPRRTVEICLNKYNMYRFFEEISPEFSLNPSDIGSELVVEKPVKGRGSRGVKVEKGEPESSQRLHLPGVPTW